MVTVVQVMYPNGGSFDWDYYLNTHMPMVEREFDLLEWSVLRGTGVSIPHTYQAIATLLFKDDDTWAKGFAEVGPKLLADIPRYTDVVPTIQVSVRVTPE